MRPDEFRSDRAGRVIKTATGYWAFVPHPLPPRIEMSPELLRLFAEAQHALGELAGAGRLLDNPYLLVRPAIHREAVLSSRIEGTQSDLEDLFLFEADPDQPPPSPDVREVRNYVTALEYGLDRLATLPISLRLIREVHARLMTGVRGEYALPGEFRTTQNWIAPHGRLLSEATFIPPPVEEMKEALGQWEHYLHSDDETPDLIRLAFVHYQFEAIHPFTDGNGRTGRVINSLFLVERGLLDQPILYLSRYIIAHKQDYYRLLLEVTREGAWEAWILYMLRGIEDTARWTVDRIAAVRDLTVQVTEHLRREHPKLYDRDLVDVIFEQPYCRIRNVVQRGLGTRQSASRYLHGLVDAGVLREVRAGREKLFVNPRLLSLLTGDDIRTEERPRDARHGDDVSDGTA